MAEQPPYLPSNMPAQVPSSLTPSQPTQAYPAPMGVPGQHVHPMPAAQYAPEQQNTYYTAPQPNVPAAIHYTPPPGIPVRRGGGGSAVLVWLLGGCGLIAVLFTILGVFVIKSIGESDLMKNQGGISVARRNLVEIRTSLNQYVKEHQGEYPRTLEEAVDPAYLTYSSGSTGNTVKVTYRIPRQEDTNDIAVAGFYVGEMTMNVGQKVEQRTYLRLLKDGTIVQEQITRTPLPGQ